jgi:hypothetical protein
MTPLNPGGGERYICGIMVLLGAPPLIPRPTGGCVFAAPFEAHALNILKTNSKTLNRISIFIIRLLNSHPSIIK